MLELLKQASFQLLPGRSLLSDMLKHFKPGKAVKAGGGQTPFGRIAQDNHVSVRSTTLSIG